MKKAIDQTVRDLKRGVNKKVLKVPGIEQKVLDATSNEPWDPHGSLLADIAMASRNYHEYQLIMAVIWRRITDTGKNWRHVYKALVVLEYLVAHGSERVIDEIKERSYQISMLSDFQYIDSSGRDQGNNVRRKSQSLVILANDKERVYEVRQKAAANRDKLRNTSASGIYRSGSHSSSGGYSDKYDYDRYEDQNGDGRSRERGYDYRDEDLYRNRNSYGGDGDCCGRESYRDDDHASSRGSAAKDEDCSQDERQLERKYSGQYMGGPPCYEDAVGETQSPAHSKRNGETAAASAPTTSPSRSNNQNLPAAVSSDFSEPAAASGYSPFPTHTKMEASAPANPVASSKTASSTDSASNTVPQTTSTSAEMDLLGSLQDPFLSNSSANISITSAAADVLADSGAVPTLAASQAASNVAFDDPFGDAPFKATPATDAVPAQQPSSMPFQQPPGGQKVQNGGLSHPISSQFDSATNFQFEDSFSTVASSSSGVPYAQPFLSPSQSLPQEQSTPHQEDDILAGILPPARSLDIVTSQAALASLPGQSAQPTANPYTQPRQLTSNPYSQPAQLSTTGNGQLALPDANLYGQPGLPSATLYSQLAQPIGNMIWQQTQSTANPYAHPPSPTANSYNQPIQSANPYFQPSQLTINPYNRPQSPANPNGQSLPRPATNTYGQPPQPTANSYSQSQLPANPYAQPPQPTANSYSQSQLPANPYAQPPQPTANSYSQSQLPANPYAQPPQPTANSYSQSQLPANPYAHPPQPTGNPYGQQLHASPYRQQAPPAADPYSNIRQQSSHPYGQPSASSAGKMYGGFNPQSGHMALAAPNTVARMSSGPASQSSGGSCFSQEVSTSTVSLQGAEAHPPTRPALQLSGGNIVSEQASAAPTTSQSAHQGAHASATPHNNDVMGNLISQTGANTLAALQAVPQSKDKFEPKSAVWADTLSRGLVNLNISGTKTNPLSDIGIDFDAINRKEKRMEKPAASPVTSTVTMGKAMGSGSGMGRAGASALRLPANPMMGSGMGMGMRPGAGIGMGMGMGMGGGPSAAMSIEGYGGMNQQHIVMGLNMGMGMGQGVNIQPQVAMHPGSTMPGGYHPMMGSGGYAPQQPYGGNYR